MLTPNPPSSFPLSETPFRADRTTAGLGGLAWPRALSQARTRVSALRRYVQALADLEARDLAQGRTVEDASPLRLQQAALKADLAREEERLSDLLRQWQLLQYLDVPADVLATLPEGASLQPLVDDSSARQALAHKQRQRELAWLEQLQAAHEDRLALALAQQRGLTPNACGVPGLPGETGVAAASAPQRLLPDGGGPWTLVPDRVLGHGADTVVRDNTLLPSGTVPPMEGTA